MAVHHRESGVACVVPCHPWPVVDMRRRGAGDKNVLWKCESGSGAPLGASIGRACLTGKCFVRDRAMRGVGRKNCQRAMETPFRGVVLC
jgi:hypothetical protein